MGRAPARDLAIAQPVATRASAGCRVLVFARAPVPGAVKRRLIPVLGEVRAAALYALMAQRCLQAARHAAAAGVELWCAPDTGHPFFAACRQRLGVSLHAQSGGDLGARMKHALHRSLPAVIVGSDCPAVTTQLIRQALRTLAAGMDAVVGPAEDGGYVLLGLAQASGALFRSMPWGCSSVLEETRSRLRALGWSWRELRTGWDVDRPEDVERLLSEPAWVDIAPQIGYSQPRAGNTARGGER